MLEVFKIAGVTVALRSDWNAARCLALLLLSMLLVFRSHGTSLSTDSVVPPLLPASSSRLTHSQPSLGNNNRCYAHNVACAICIKVQALLVLSRYVAARVANT